MRRTTSVCVSVVGVVVVVSCIALWAAPFQSQTSSSYYASAMRFLKGMPWDAMGRTLTTEEKQKIKTVYPRMFSLKRLLGRWSPDVPYVPTEEVGGGTKFDSLETLDYQDPEQRKRGKLLRDSHVPFKMYNVPNINEVVNKWKDDKYMEKGMGHLPFGVGQGYHNHFMFFRAVPKMIQQDMGSAQVRPRLAVRDWNNLAHTSIREGDVHHSLRPSETTNSFEKAVRRRGYTFPYPPPEQIQMSFPTYRNTITDIGNKIEAASKKFMDNPDAPITLKDPYDGAGRMHARYKLGKWPYANFTAAPLGHTFAHYYLTFGDDPQKGSKPPGKDIEIWRKWDDFFIIDANDIRGIHCRFGMRGVVAEGHWDGHLNFIAILRGQKRYILLPPSECKHGNIMEEGPSKRHFGYDFSDPETVFVDEISSRHAAEARAVETVLKAGEVLYVPSFWIHYIISLHDESDTDPMINFQCNTRSGTSPMAHEDKNSINSCLGDQVQIPTHRWWETPDNWHEEEEQAGLDELKPVEEEVKAGVAENA